FSAGGEYGGAATFMAEYARAGQRGMYGSFLEVGTLCGMASAAAISLILLLVLGNDTMAAWGWRIPFLVAIPLGYIGLYLRSKMQETPVFREFEENSAHLKQQGVGIY